MSYAVILTTAAITLLITLPAIYLIASRNETRAYLQTVLRLERDQARFIQTVVELCDEETRIAIFNEYHARWINEILTRD
jgi:hypothetical protein